MRLTVENSLTCNKCGYKFDESTKERYVFCPGCKSIKNVEIHS